MKQKATSLTEGLFISFEGGEGVGKSTQVRLLADTLERAQLPVRTFREPGGTKIGEAIRFITHDPTNTMLDDRAEALLFAACRAQLVAEVYRPLLDKKYVVIADRYVDSSYVYQGIARGLGLEAVKAVNEFAINGLLPHITFLLDLDYKEGQRRRHATVKVDRMDMQHQKFYETVHSAYHTIVQHHSSRIVVIDATRDRYTIHRVVTQYVLEYINAKLLTKTSSPLLLDQLLGKEKTARSSYNWLAREK